MTEFVKSKISVMHSDFPTSRNTLPHFSAWKGTNLPRSQITRVGIGFHTLEFIQLLCQWEKTGNGRVESGWPTYRPS